MAHGWPKLAGGSATWTKVGAAMQHVGLDLAPTFFGFMAAVSEFFGGLLLALGVLFRPASALLLATMSVALTMHVRTGDPFTKWSHAAELGVVFLALLLTGPGKLVVAGARR